MSISGLARSDGLEKYWAPSHFSEESDRIEITSSHRKKVEVATEDYPFPHQILLYGEFIYHLDGRREFSPTANGYYLYRPDSGLFLTKVRQNNVDVDKILNEFNSVIGDATEIRQIKSLSRESLWEFLRGAEEISEIELRGPEGRKTLRDVIREDQEELGRHELTIDLDDHLIVSARASYRKPGTDKRLVLRYDRGRFEIQSQVKDDTDYLLDDVAEYVIQMIERDILSSDT